MGNSDQRHNINNDTYRKINIWGGDKESSKKYWRKYNRIFNFGYEKCELGRDFWDIDEYISEHND